jgi:glucose-6-phosphate isomerase
MKFTTTHALASPSDLSELAQQLMPYKEHLKRIAMSPGSVEPESSIQLPNDSAQCKYMQEAARRLHTPTLQYIVIIGIGGSNLGTQAIYEAIAGSMHLLVDRLPKLLFLDTISDEKMTAVTRVLERLTHKEDFLVVTISKSGTTLESIANFEVLWSFVCEQFGECQERFVVITDEGSKFWEMAGKKKMERFSIPHAVGGRYSVFSAVGLLPIALAGIDITELVAGAAEAVADGMSNDLTRNRALTAACLRHFHAKHGRTIQNIFLFSPKRAALGKWERQLIAESLGKNGQGLLPIVSIGSTDLHSQAQLYLEGPDTIFTTFISTFIAHVHAVPNHPALAGLVPDIHGKSLDSIMQAIHGGIKEAYANTGRPFIDIDLERGDAWELGYYMQWKMLEVMFLARLMGVNAFDQPAVERYKVATRELLKTRRN